jgi:hypothetical protein
MAATPQAQATTPKPPPAPPPNSIPISFSLGDRIIDGAVVKPVTFAAFNDFITEAQTMTQPQTWEGKLRRVRMTKQVVYYANGVPAPLTQEEVLRMPIPAARNIAARLDENEGKLGKIVRAGDGIDQAIIYELGTPLQMRSKEPITIRELEFMAKTYGDIEDVLAAPTTFQQAAQLIATVAKPLGTSLTALPSWAVGQIMFADGFAIVRDVLPHFLGSPAESPSE